MSMARTGCLSPGAASLMAPELPGYRGVIPAPAEGSALEPRGGGARCQPSRRIHVTGAWCRVLPRCGQGCAWSGMRCVRDQLDRPAQALPNASTKDTAAPCPPGHRQQHQRGCQRGSPAASSGQGALPAAVWCTRSYLTFWQRQLVPRAGTSCMQHSTAGSGASLYESQNLAAGAFAAHAVCSSRWFDLSTPSSARGTVPPGPATATGVCPSRARPVRTPHTPGQPPLPRLVPARFVAAQRGRLARPTRRVSRRAAAARPAPPDRHRSPVLGARAGPGVLPAGVTCPPTAGAPIRTVRRVPALQHRGQRHRARDGRGASRGDGRSRELGGSTTGGSRPRGPAGTGPAAPL